MSWQLDAAPNIAGMQETILLVLCTCAPDFVSPELPFCCILQQRNPWQGPILPHLAMAAAGCSWETTATAHLHGALPGPAHSMSVRQGS